MVKWAFFCIANIHKSWMKKELFPTSSEIHSILQYHVLITFPLSGSTINKYLLIQMILLKNLGLNKNNSKTTKFLDPHPPINFSDDFG